MPGSRSVRTGEKRKQAAKKGEGAAKDSERPFLPSLHAVFRAFFLPFAPLSWSLEQTNG